MRSTPARRSVTIDRSSSVTPPTRASGFEATPRRAPSPAARITPTATRPFELTCVPLPLGAGPPAAQARGDTNACAREFGGAPPARLVPVAVPRVPQSRVRALAADELGVRPD